MTIAPLELSFEIDCSPSHAFSVWTARLSLWWPPGHTTDGGVVTLEPGVGGRIYETTPAGEVLFGTITSWDPPRSLGYRWHIRRTPSEATDVLLRFVPLGDRTRLEIVQTGWERLGAEGQAWRDANTSGWNALIPGYLAATAARS